jgi:hypothetical protein
MGSFDCFASLPLFSRPITSEALQGNLERIFEVEIANVGGFVFTKGGQLSGCRAKLLGHFHQIGKRVGFHFLHDLATVRFHSDFADAELGSDLLI